MKRVILLVLVFLLLPAIASAATIEGAVYDLSLERAADVVVEIDTAPKQQVIAKEGQYSFEVGLGEYILSARQLSDGRVVASVSESISVESEGNYTLDLILFPNLSEEAQILQEIEGMDVEDLLEARPDYSLFILVGIGLLAVLLAALFLKVRRLKPVREPRLPEDLERMVRFIKKEGGRATQKAIRKELGLSEAKISLMVADLEARGAVKKVKKGRGNIIILKK